MWKGMREGEGVLGMFIGWVLIVSKAYIAIAYCCEHA